jgi:ethanolamine utilization protein EutA
VADLFLTPPLGGAPEYDGVVFSGGVGEYVYGRESRSFGDLGEPLGRALRRRLDAGALPWRLLPAKECIRATVVGASQYSVQVSGNTIYLSNPGLLPQRNLQVLRPVYDLGGTIDPDGLAQAVRRHFTAFDLQEGGADVALAFHWHGDPSFPRVSAFAEGLVRALPGTLAAGRPLYLVFDHDVARLVGALLKEERELPVDVLSIDGIVLRDFDFVDIGRQLEGSGTVPVTIKSLVFQL